VSFLPIRRSAFRSAFPKLDLKSSVRTDDAHRNIDL
jgi:hypothetical protein